MTTIRGSTEISTKVYTLCQLRTGEDGRAFYNFPYSLELNCPEDSLALKIPRDMPRFWADNLESTGLGYHNEGLWEMLYGDESLVLSYAMDLSENISQVASSALYTGKWLAARDAQDAMLSIEQAIYAFSTNLYIDSAVWSWALRYVIAVTLGECLELFRLRARNFHDGLERSNVFDLMPFNPFWRIVTDRADTVFDNWARTLLPPKAVFEGRWDNAPGVSWAMDRY